MRKQIRKSNAVLKEWGRLIRREIPVRGLYCELDGFIKALPEDVKKPLVCKYVGNVTAAKGAVLCKISKDEYDKNIRDGKLVVWGWLNVSRENNRKRISNG